MRTLDGHIWSRCSIVLPTPPGHICSAHRTGKDGARVRINASAHQEKVKNEEIKTGKRKVGKKTGDRF